MEAVPIPLRTLFHIGNGLVTEIFEPKYFHELFLKSHLVNERVW